MEMANVFEELQIPKQILILPQHCPAQQWEEELSGISIMMSRILVGKCGQNPGSETRFV